MKNPKKPEFFIEAVYPFRPGSPKLRISDGEFEWIVDKEAEGVPRAKLIDLLNMYRELYDN